MVIDFRLLVMLAVLGAGSAHGQTNGEIQIQNELGRIDADLRRIEQNQRSQQNSLPYDHYDLMNLLSRQAVQKNHEDYYQSNMTYLEEQSRLEQIRRVAEIGAQDLERYGPEGQRWAQQLRTDPYAAVQMAESYGGFAAIEQRLRDGQAARRVEAFESSFREFAAKHRPAEQQKADPQLLPYSAQNIADGSVRKFVSVSHTIPGSGEGDPYGEACNEEFDRSGRVGPAPGWAGSLNRPEQPRADRGFEEGAG